MKAGASDTSKTLLAFLREHLSSYPSVKAIKRAIEAGQCKINGRIETFSTHRVREGDEIEIELFFDTPKFSIEILFEDEELLVLNKPPGIASEAFTQYFLVHRLDKNTSGAILFAKTLSMQKALTDLFRQRKVQKTYLAICDGSILEKEWIVDNYLGKKASYEGGSLYGKASRERGKRAITHFLLLKSSPIASLVQARPITGRTHQIRVHLKGRGHPVLGDFQYGQSFQCPLRPSRQMLHSHEIIFPHPVGAQKIHCVAPVLNDFLSVQKKLFGA